MSSITGHEISLSRFVDLKRELLSHPEPMKCSCSQASRHGWKSSQHTEKMGRNPRWNKSCSVAKACETTSLWYMSRELMHTPWLLKDCERPCLDFKSISCFKWPVPNLYGSFFAAAEARVNLFKSSTISRRSLIQRSRRISKNLLWMISEAKNWLVAVKINH